MNRKAMIVKEIIRKMSTTIKVEAFDKVFFNEKLLPDYEKIFNQLVFHQIIVGEFSKNEWIVKYGEFNSEAKFIFDIQFSEIITALKCYVIEKMKQGISVREIHNRLYLVQEAIRITRGFREDEKDTLSEHLAILGYRKRPKMSRAVIEFLSFYKIETSDLYNDIGIMFTKEEKRTREIPPFNNVLIFDDILNRFFIEASNDEQLKYYMIFIWWRLTKVIPMRPIEFFDLQINCVYKKEDGSFWITLPRKKQPPSNNEEIEVTDTLQINSELYNLIKDYLHKASGLLDSTYLLSYPIYLKFFTHYPSSKIKKVEKSKFRIMLKHFYQEIIFERYGVSNLAVLKAGDTRHFAFCNMMLQGFNMLSIARIGGHTKLREQLHYHAHLEYFAESAVQILAQNHRNKFIKIKFHNYPNLVETKSKIFQKEDYSELHSVDYGYCTNHLSNCTIGECRFCEYYHFEPSPEEYKKGLNWLKDCSDILKIRIAEQLNFMREISKNMEYNLKNLQYPIQKQEILSTKAKELKSLIDQKAIVDSLIMEELGNHE